MKRLLSVLMILLFLTGSGLYAQGPTNISRPYSVISDTPTITILATSVNSSTIPTLTTTTSLQVQMKFGTVTGTYTTCTAQLQTSMNDSDWLTIGAAASLTVTTGTVNTWVVLPVIGATTVTTGAVSAAAALVFGTSTRIAFACSGAYGTTAPVVIKTVAR